MNQKIIAFIILSLLIPTSVWAMAKRPPAPEITTKPVTKPVESGITLQKAYQLTLKQSETLAKTDVDIETSWANFLKATGDIIGEGNFVITNFRQEPQKAPTIDGGLTSTGSALRNETRQRKFVFTQPIFQGFKSIGVVAGAGNIRSQRVNEKRRAEQLLFQDVVNSFYSVLKYGKDISITNDIITLIEKRILDLEEREKIGKSRTSEIATAQTRRNTLEANLAQMKGALAYEKRLLEFLLGISLEDQKLIDSTDDVPAPDTLERYISMAEHRPDVLALKSIMKTFKQNIIIKQSDLWPNLTLDATTYEKREGFQSSIDWDLLMTLDIPLYTGGTTLGNLKEAIGLYKKTKLDYQRQKRVAEMEIKQSHDLWFASFTEFKAFQKAVVASKKNYDLQQEDYTHNLVNNLDVLVALESLNQTNLDLNQSSYNLKKNYWNFEVATGVCCDNI